jgi:diaminopimelate decarboxylase
VVTPQDLSACEVGDLIVFHDAGAYDASMSSNSNSRSLIPRVLVDGNELRLIWRRQTIQALMVLV